MVILNEIHYNLATSTFVSSLPHFESPHAQNRLLRIESTGRYTHHKQVKMVYHYIEKAKSKSSRLSYSVNLIKLLNRSNEMGKIELKFWHINFCMGDRAYIMVYGDGRLF
jgi:hypothetical protein